MPRIEYTSFFNGNSSDERLAPTGSILESKSVDGTSTSLGICNGPKVNKQIVTGEKPYYIYQDDITDDKIYIVTNDGTDGYIYLGNDADNTPTRTILTSDTTHNKLEFIHDFGNGTFIIGQNGSGAYQLHRIAGLVGVGTATYDILSQSINTDEGVYFLSISGILYIGLGSYVIKIETSGNSPFYTINEFNLVSGRIVGMSQHGATILLYTSKGEVVFWDSTSSEFDAANNLGFIPSNVISGAKYDYVSDHEGNMYVGTGYSMTKVSEIVKSKRLDTNGSIRVNNNLNTGAPAALSSNGYGQFFGTSDNIKGIYQYNNILPGQNPGLFKIITTDNAHNDVTDISCTMVSRFSKDRLYFGYYNGTNYGVDYVDFSSNEKTRDGWFVTPVFVGNVMEKQELVQVQVVASNTSGDNYVKVYVRVDNGSWSEIMNINDSSDDIVRVEDVSVKDKFQEIQFKVELHNDTQGTNAPILHGIMFEYEEIEKV